MIITPRTGYLCSTFFTFLELYLIAPIQTIDLTIKKVLSGMHIPSHTSIFIILTNIHLQQIAILLIESGHTLLNSITDLAPIQTQQTRIAFHCVIANYIHIHVHFLWIHAPHRQLPLECLVKGGSERQLVLTILSEGRFMSTWTKRSI